MVVDVKGVAVLRAVTSENSHKFKSYDCYLAMVHLSTYYCCNLLS